MGRSILAVVAGVVLWSVLWVSFNMGMQAAFPAIIDPTRYLDHVPVLITYIVVSFILSVAAGWVTALVAGRKPVQHALALGVVQLMLGIGFEASYWSLLPVWYHVVFLALLVPGNLLGGRIRAARGAVSRYA